MQAVEAGAIRVPKADRLELIARTLGVDPHELLHDLDEAETTIEHVDVRRAGVIRRLLRWLPAAEWERLEAMAGAAFSDAGGEREQQPQRHPRQQNGQQHEPST